MKAMVCTRYGGPEVLEFREVPKPRPKKNQILIQVRAASVNSSDCLLRGLQLPMPMRLMARLAVGLTRPRNPVLGLVLAGQVEALGPGAKRFKTGDRVFAFTQLHFGAYAQYACLPENGIVEAMPGNLDFEQAAALPYGGLLAAHYLRKGRLRAGHDVLVYGASGAVGTAAVQLARYFGARVTGVCGPANADLVKSLGAEAVVDYTRQNFIQSARLYDLILVAIGQRMGPPSATVCQKALKPKGLYVSVDQGMAQTRAQDLAVLKVLAETGALKPVIDRTYTLEQIPEAHRYVEQGHKKGSVIVRVEQD